MAQNIIQLYPRQERPFKKHMALYGAVEYILIHNQETRLKRPTEILTCAMVYAGLQLFEPSTPEQIFWAKLKAGILIICSDCGDPKERSEFFTDKRKRNGLYSECKECHRRRDRDRKWALRNVGIGKAA